MAKSFYLCVVLWLTGGLFGLHHFYLGRYMHGLLWFCTLGGFFVGWVGDAFLISKYVAQANGLPAYLAGWENRRGRKVPTTGPTVIIGSYLFAHYFESIVYFALDNYIGHLPRNTILKDGALAGLTVLKAIIRTLPVYGCFSIGEKTCSFRCVVWPSVVLDLVIRALLVIFTPNTSFGLEPGDADRIIVLLILQLPIATAIAAASWTHRYRDTLTPYPYWRRSVLLIAGVLLWSFFVFAAFYNHLDFPTSPYGAHTQKLKDLVDEFLSAESVRNLSDSFRMFRILRKDRGLIYAGEEMSRIFGLLGPTTFSTSRAAYDTDTRLGGSETPPGRHHVCGTFPSHFTTDSLEFSIPDLSPLCPPAKFHQLVRQLQDPSIVASTISRYVQMVLTAQSIAEVSWAGPKPRHRDLEEDDLSAATVKYPSTNPGCRFFVSRLRINGAVGTSKYPFPFKPPPLPPYYCSPEEGSSSTAGVLQNTPPQQNSWTQCRDSSSGSSGGSGSGIAYANIPPLPRGRTSPVSLFRRLGWLISPKRKDQSQARRTTDACVPTAWQEWIDQFIEQSFCSRDGDPVASQSTDAVQQNTEKGPMSLTGRDRVVYLGFVLTQVFLETQLCHCEALLGLTWMNEAVRESSAVNTRSNTKRSRNDKSEAENGENSMLPGLQSPRCLDLHFLDPIVEFFTRERRKQYALYCLKEGLTVLNQITSLY